MLCIHPYLSMSMTTSDHSIFSLGLWHTRAHYSLYVCDMESNNSIICLSNSIDLSIFTMSMICMWLLHVYDMYVITLSSPCLWLTGDPTFKLKEPNHHWIAVAINNFWYLIDLIWCVQQKTDFYFLCEPAIFVYNHLPVEPDWQLLFRPVKRSEFMDLAYVLL